MLDDEKYLVIAAQICSDSLCDYDIGLLNGTLIFALRSINEMCRRVGGELKSRQVIAQIIYQWQKDNPDKIVYGD